MWLSGATAQLCILSRCGSLGTGKPDMEKVLRESNCCSPFLEFFQQENHSILAGYSLRRDGVQLNSFPIPLIETVLGFQRATGQGHGFSCHASPTLSTFVENNDTFHSCLMNDKS